MLISLQEEIKSYINKDSMVSCYSNCAGLRQPVKILCMNMLNVFLVPMVTKGTISCSEDKWKRNPMRKTDPF